MTDVPESPRDWHRIFGLLLSDFFCDKPFTVETEVDLSIQQQLLDVAIVRREETVLAEPFPDGLDDLGDFNVITFKSHHEPLDIDAMEELASHAVAYRKLVSPAPNDLLPRSRFHRYAVCAAYPHNLAQVVAFQKRSTGVYECTWGATPTRIVVIGRLPEEPHNAPLLVLSASKKRVAYARRVYHKRSPHTSTVLDQVLHLYNREGFMSYTIEDLERDITKRMFKRLTPEEQAEALKDVPLGQLLANLPPEARLAGLPPEARLAGLSVEARLAGLSPEQIQQYLEVLKAAPKPRPRRRK